jgi:outer membrane protein, heavy metal efflux system
MRNKLMGMLLLALLAGPAAAADDAVLTLRQALQVALANNPSLAQAGAKARALAEVPSQVGTLPDPVLSLNALNLPTDTFSLSQEAMTQMQVGIGVTLPFPGKLGLREQAAGYQAQAAQFGVDETRLVLGRDVRATWWNLFYLDRAIAIVRHNQDLLREFVKIAEAKYRTGQGMQSDVLLAQVELSKLLDIGIGLGAVRRSQAAALNALLGRSADSAVLLPQQADEKLPVAPEFSALHDVALQARPLLSAQRERVQAAQSQVALAEKDYYPDFKVGAAYGYRRGYNPNGSPRADVASFTLSMNLPIFSGSKQDHELAQRRADELDAQYGLQDRLVQVDSEIEQALADYRADREKVLLFKTGIIPQASQTTAAMLAAYQVDKVDFLNLIRAQVTLYNYQTQYWKALSASWQAWARLQAAVGKPLAQTAADKEKQP